MTDKLADEGKVMQVDMQTLIERVEAMEGGGDNAADVLVEIALFTPDERCTSVRANNAGTKVIYTLLSGVELTRWAHDWTIERNRKATAAALRTHMGEGK